MESNYIFYNFNFNSYEKSYKNIINSIKNLVVQMFIYF